MTVKLVLLDESDRMLLINAADPSSGELHWYPVGGGVEAGESLQEAACREAREEVGLLSLPHFEPAPAALSDYEARTVRGFRWWYADELAQTGDTVFPPDLGVRLAALLRDGPAGRPVDIGAAAGR